MQSVNFRLVMLAETL